MIQLKRTIARAVAGVATVAALAVTMVGIPAQAAEVQSSASDSANVVQALKYIQELNALRAKQNPSFTTQQIADAWTADYKTTYTADQFDPVMSDGKPRAALKVNDELMKWAQSRANELAELGDLDYHKGMWNGSPSWAKSTKWGGQNASFLNNPEYKGGTFFVGPENLAYAYSADTDPIQMWNREATYPGPDFVSWRQGYGHYLNNLNHLANLVGFGVAQSSNGRWFMVLELAYSDSQPSKTVDQALAEYIKPQSADAVSTSAVEGMKPSLPNTVNVHYSDGSQQHMPVTWNDTTDWSATEEGQTITINGTVTGTTVTTTATVAITAATAQSADNPDAITTDSGKAPALPKTATIHYNNGQAKAETVTWDSVDKAQYSKREGGDFIVKGTVHGLPVQVKVIVNPATAQSVEQPADTTVVVGQSFTAPSTLNVTYSNGDKILQPVVWSDTDTVTTNTVGDYTIHGTAAGKSVTLIVHVVAAKITGISNPNGITVKSGTTVADLGLPTTVHATFDNNTSDDVPVSWNALTAEQQQTLKARKGGSFNLSGTVTGWDKPLQITVTVSPATVVDADISNADKQVQTPSGTAPALARQGRVVWSNGDTEMVDVQWDAIEKSQYAKRDGGTFTVQGKLAGKTVTTTVTVLPAEVSNITPTAPVTTEAKTAPKLPETTKVTWSNGDTTDEQIDWNITDTDYAKRGEKQISGTILTGTKNKQTITTTLTVTSSIVKVNNPADITTPSGTDPKDLLPQQVTVTYSDDESEKVAVTWADSSKDQYTQTHGGSYQLTGTVAGTTLPATITVKVTPATLDTVDNPTAITVASGTKEADLQLPNTVVAHYSDGTTAPVSVKWDALTDKQKETLAAKDEGSFTLSGTAENKNVTLTVNVTPATITGVDSPDDITVDSGTTADELQLPATVTVHWSNGSTSEAAVQWNALTDEQQATLASIKGGSFTLGGDVAGYTKPQPRLLMRLFRAVTGATSPADDVTITVHVTPATVTSIAPLPDVSTDSGVAPKLPETASVTWSNGQTTHEPITWNKLDKALYSTRNASTFDVAGTAAGSPVKVTVKVNAATIVSVTAQTDTLETVVGTAPATLPSATVTWSNGDTESVMPSWDAISDNAVAQAGEFTEQGTVTVDNQTFNVSVKVVVKAKEEPKPEPEQKPDPKPTDNQQAGKNNSTKQQSTPAQSASQSKSSTTLAATGAAIAAIVVLAVLALAVGIALRVRSAKSTAATQSQHTEE